MRFWMVFLTRQANKTPYGRACAADAFASRRAAFNLG